MVFAVLVQIGVIHFRAFVVFWPNYFSTVCPVLGKMDLVDFPTKNFVFRPDTYIPNMILAVKNLGNSHHTFVVGAYFLARSFILHQAIHPSSPIHKTTFSIGNPTSKFSSFALTKPLGNSYDFTVKPEFRIIS